MTFLVLCFIAGLVLGAAAPRRITVPALAIAAPLLAIAQVPDPAADPNAFLTQLVTAIQGGQWRVAVVLAAIGAVYLLRTFGTKIPGAVGAFLATSRGGASLALLVSLVTGLGAAMLSGTPITVKVVLDVLLLGFTAIGGWVGVRRLLGMDTATEAAKVFQLQPAGSAAAAADQLGKPPVA